jgi:excinuclease ABC subunit A
VIRNADWIIDLGPEGGEDGGTIVAEGTPAQVAQVATSHTAKFLRRYFPAEESIGSGAASIAAADAVTVNGQRKKSTRRRSATVLQ